MADQEAAAVARLTASVEANASATDSIITLLGNIAQEIRDNVDDSTALNALADTVDAKTAAIAAAVTANTPVEDEPPADGEIPPVSDTGGPAGGLVTAPTGEGDANTPSGETGVDVQPNQSPGSGIEPQVPAPGASDDGQGGALSTDGSSSATGGAGPSISDV